MSNETVAEAFDSLYSDFAAWWKFKFPVAIVIFLTICAVGYVVGKFVEQVLLLRLSNEEPWAHLYRKEVASPQSKSWWPKWPWNKNKSKTVMESSFKPVVQTAVDIAAIPTRSIWKGNMTRDGARISGYLTMIGIDLAGAIIALEKAGISLTPLVVTGGVSALAISLSLRNLLGNLFAGVLLMFYDVCRQGEVIRFVPAPGLPSNDLRILTITLKHTVLVNAEEEATADFLILPNTAMLSPLYVKNTEKVAKRVEDLQEDMKTSSESAINMGVLRRNVGAPHLSF